MHFNEYYFDKEEGMKLRSGKTINCIINSELYKALLPLLDEIEWWDISESSITEYHRVMNKDINKSSEIIKLNSYSVIMITFHFLELYYNDLYTKKELYKLYKFFKNKINEFIIFFVKNDNKICDYIIEYEEWDYKTMFPIYKEDYSYDVYNERYKCMKNINLIKELQEWNHKFNIPHKSIKKNNLYNKISNFTNEDCSNHIFGYL